MTTPPASQTAVTAHAEPTSRVSDVDFTKHIIRVRQSVDSASRTIGSVKSKASSADLPMSREVETRLQSHLEHHSAKHDLIFVNRRGRPLCANKLRQLRHSDPRITLAVYAHVLGDQQRTAVQNRSARLVN